MEMRKVREWIVRYGLALLVLAGALYGARRLVASRPETTRREMDSRAVPVRVITPVRTNYQVRVSSMGEVLAARHVSLRTQVGGRIVEVHPAFESGGRFREGEVLLVIEPDDYETALSEARSHYAQARLQEDLELQRQLVARSELTQSGSDVPDGAGRRIALREPQVEAARAAVTAADAAVRRAQRNLDRTKVVAPFDAVLLTKNVDIGSVVSAQAAVAELAAVDQFHIKASFSPGQLRWMPERDRDGHFLASGPVEVRARSGQSWFTREGRMVRLLGDLSGNMVRVLVSVPDPLTGDDDPLLLGTFAHCLLPGRALDGVLAVPLRAVRDGGVVWVAGAGDRLERLTPEIIWTGDDLALLGDGLNANARVIVSALVADVEGMPLIVEDEEAQQP